MPVLAVSHSQFVGAFPRSPGIGDLVRIETAPFGDEFVFAEQTFSVLYIALKALEQFATIPQEKTTSMVSTQAGSKLFHKNIPGYTPPDPVYDTYIDEDGEEKKRKVWANLLRFRLWLAERCVCCSRERYPPACQNGTSRSCRTSSAAPTNLIRNFLFVVSPLGGGSLSVSGPFV